LRTGEIERRFPKVRRTRGERLQLSVPRRSVKVAGLPDAIGEWRRSSTDRTGEALIDEVPSISLEMGKFCSVPSDRDKKAPAHVDASKAGEHNS